MTEAQRIDASDRSFLAVCSCGWRGRTVGLRSSSWQEAADHARRVHGDAEGRAVRTYARLEQREARRGR